MKHDIKPEETLTSSERSKKVFIIFSAAFLGIVFLTGIIFGAIGIAKSAGSVMKYKGTYLKDGVANYLASSFKYDFMSTLKRRGIDCYDSDHFWQSEAEDGKTWGEILSENTEKHLKRVLVGSYLFDKNARLTKTDKAVIDKAVNEVLEYRADADIGSFNEMAKKMGFNYRDFKRATELLYKYEMAQTVIFGYDGTSLASGLFPEQCDTYYENTYSRVKLMFVRTEGEYATDPETNEQIYSEFDSDRKAEIQDLIEEIRMLIHNTENELVAEGMNEEAFDWYVSEKFSDWNPESNRDGYYFSSESSYSREFALDAPEVVKLALSLEQGHYAECEVDIGVCFIYKAEIEPKAYEDNSLKHFFGDFYSCAADYVYSESVDVYLADVTVKEKYDKAVIIDIPYNQELSVKFG